MAELGRRHFGSLYTVISALLGLTMAWAAARAESPASISSAGQGTAMKLWYDRPATTWMTEALPIGNGRLGAMVFGGVKEDRIQFNEISMWTGMEVNSDD